MKALVTRPADDAASLAAALAKRGIEPVLEPLLTIRLVDDSAARLAALLPGTQALLFTSANGVRAFASASSAGAAFSNTPASSRHSGDRGNDQRGAAGGLDLASAHRALPVFAVGDATARAARDAGFAGVTSADGNVEDLARLVVARATPGAGALLHAAASDVAGDLAGRLATAGFDVRRTALYDAVPVPSLSDAARQALADGTLDLVIFFSPRTAATFARLALAARLAERCRRVTALALSPAVAKAMKGLAWRAVEIAATPQEEALLVTLDAIMPSVYAGRTTSRQRPSKEWKTAQ